MLRKTLSFFCACFFMLSNLLGQVVYTSPVFPRQGDAVTIYFDATQGTGGLADCNCEVYLHTGVLTNLSTSASDWKYVVTTWGVANPDWLMTPVAGQSNLYSYEISPSILDFYGVTGTEIVEELAFVFRNGDGSLEGKAEGGTDIFYPVYPEDFDFTTLLLSPEGSTLIQEPGSTITISLVASEEATISVYDNETLVTSITGLSLDYELAVGEEGSHEVEIFADNGGGQQSNHSFQYEVVTPGEPLDPPAGTEHGITILDGQTIRLALYAPDKQFVYVIGDFNNWELNSAYRMNNSVDGNLWWLDIEGLTPGENYTFQYLVDGTLNVPDPYSTLVLDPFHDAFIPAETYPNLPAYPTGKTDGIVSVINTSPETYEWQNNDFIRPDRQELVVYELLIRDFIERHDYTTLIDTLDYLSRLGINAIELMPVNEFEGNNSWGYNPSFHLALDKYYGPINEFKRFIDACHDRGIAVLLDVVFNHAYGQSPLAQLYWNASTSRPLPENPWLNVEPTHAFNVGNDFNHESEATRYYIDRAIQYWLDEFRIDGFRFDLSKGLTQNSTGPFENFPYDATRIAIIKHYADVAWEVTPDAYIILEHFADNWEEIELSNYGMLLWGNMNHEYNEASMGYNSNLEWISYQQRNWGFPYLVGYMESHDEERLNYKNQQFGNADGAYNIQNAATAMDRMELVNTFFLTIPGPKMIWQFGELGYDYSIFTCSNGTVDPTNGFCRLDPKPIRWDFQDDPNRKDLFEVVRGLIHLKTNYEVFNTTDYYLEVWRREWKKIHLNGADMDVAIQGNFNVVTEAIQAPFQHTGWWYEYFTGDSLLVNSVDDPMELEPGEYRLYTTERITPPGGFVTSSREVVTDEFQLQVFPNPAREHVEIAYQLPSRAAVRLEIYAVTGQLLEVIEDSNQLAGNHRLQWRAKESGTFLVKLITADKIEVERIIVSRE